MPGFASLLLLITLSTTPVPTTWQALADEARELAGTGSAAGAAEKMAAAVDLAERQLPPDSVEELGPLLEKLADLLVRAERVSEAERVARRALLMREVHAGGTSPTLVSPLHTLGFALLLQQRFAEAEPILQRAVSIAERDPEHQNQLLEVLGLLATVYIVLDRSADLDRVMARMQQLNREVMNAFAAETGQPLPLRQEGLEPGELDTAQMLTVMRAGGEEEDALRDLAFLPVIALQRDQSGLDTEAAVWYQRSLELRERAFGPASVEAAEGLLDLASFHFNRFRLGEAEPLFSRAADVLAECDPCAAGAAFAVAGLADIAALRGQLAPARDLYRRAIELRRRAYGGDHSFTAHALHRLGRVEGALGLGNASDQAARAMYDRLYPAGHEFRGYDLDRLDAFFTGQIQIAVVSNHAGRDGLAWQEKTLGPGIALANALVQGAQNVEIFGRQREAIPALERALSIYRRVLGPSAPEVGRTLQRLAVLQQSVGEEASAERYSADAVNLYRGRLVDLAARSPEDVLQEQRLTRQVFLTNLELKVPTAGSPAAQTVADSFEIGQLAVASSTAAALAGTTARLAQSSGEIGELIRRQQRLAEQQARASEEILALASTASEQRDHDKEAELLALSTTLERDLRGLARRLAEMDPAYAELLQPRALSVDATSRLLSPGEGLLLFVLGPRSGFVWLVRRSGALVRRLETNEPEVRALARRLMVQVDPFGRGTRPVDDPTDSSFPHDAASKLFRLLVGSIADELAGISHLLVVGDGPLQGIPFSLLLTGDVETNAFDPRTAPWLIRRYALSVLPAVSSLRALRAKPTRSRAKEPFLAFGDPLFGASTAGLRTLRRLPETAEELRAIAASLGAAETSLYLAEEATESAVRQARLAEYRVLAFATHALVGGELHGLAEPGLVLTQPSAASVVDDGFLSAGEVAQLDLDADLVLLSACNTAAPGDGAGGEGLSGLARAFFLAGARSLVVSHWAVSSEPTVLLTTSMIAHSTANHIGLAEALRRTMLEFIASDKLSEPRYWAPFVVVGDGQIGLAGRANGARRGVFPCGWPGAQELRECIGVGGRGSGSRDDKAG